MADLSALSAVLGAGLPATFTFLYQRLDNLLRRGGAPETELDGQTLSGELSLPLTANEGELTSRHGDLERLRDMLHVYRQNSTLVSTGDAGLLRLLGELRGTLEGIYGQRLTFVGEQGRAPSGAQSWQKSETVRGRMTGIDTEADDGNMRSVQDITTVEESGEVTGIRIRDRRNPPPDSFR
ncbi:hypothetical protein ACIREE_30355 [Streptomyces sp. NPDC102467]|uniref:hypothetical protein n=1 Tax=Streptomyces sp. NPDC102467 TaxID=3366179 RepID=UPI00382AD0CD